MTLLWIAVGVGIVTAAGLLFRRPGARARADLGSVSNNWVSEHRLAQGHDSER